MNIALLLSGGCGSRLGAEIPKQYLEVDGKPIIIYTIERLTKSVKIDGIHIVAAPEWQKEILKWIQKAKLEKKFKGFSHPGENRQMSVLNGLKDMSDYMEETDTILVHDAVRPLLSVKIIDECLKACEKYDGAMPVLPMKDTVYYSNDGKNVDRLMNRSCIFAGQAPEAYRFEAYYRANKNLTKEQIKKINGSTEPAVMAGMKIAMIPGEEENIKVTTRADLELFRRMKE